MFYSLIGTVSVVGNFIVFFVLYKSKQLRHSQYVYNCSIAISDIVWGFTVSFYFFTFFVRLLDFDPINFRQINSVLKKLESTKDKNNITTLKYH